jgi:hypothetical protein
VLNIINYVDIQSDLIAPCQNQRDLKGSLTQSISKRAALCSDNALYLYSEGIRFKSQ